MSDHTPIGDEHYTAIKDEIWYILEYIGTNSLPSPYTTALLEVIGGEADGVQVVTSTHHAHNLTYFEEISEIDLGKIEDNCYNVEYAASFLRVQLELHSALRKDRSP